MTTTHPTECERHVITLADGVTMAFRCILACPEGFLMGSRGYNPNEEPIHRVLIPEPFWMAETPVTQAQFGVWTQRVGIEHKNFHNGSGDLPAESMTWHQANDFCMWLAENYKKALPDDALFATLPCEAHWEYSCRGNTATEHHSGDGEAALKDVGWYYGNSGRTTHAVATTNAANRFGLCDMHGNVREWCLDRWDESAYRRRWDRITDQETLLLAEKFGATELHGQPESRVLRGGSDWDAATRCRSAYRFGYWAGRRGWGNGFRVCLVRSPFGQTGAAEPERTASQRRDGAEGAGSDGEAEILNTNFTD
jgi:formylglycine-generating enzyme required for sulfatase activity